MRINIIAVGKLREKYLQQGLGEYLKRMAPYAKVQILEVPDEKAPDDLSPIQAQQVKQKEARQILRRLNKESLVIALAIEGRSLSSEELVEYIAEQGNRGKSEITFVIGGSLGLSDEVLQQADLKLSFSRMTFPHQMMRLILLEQVYRAFKIIKGEPYHK